MRHTLLTLLFSAILGQSMAQSFLSPFDLTIGKVSKNKDLILFLENWKSIINKTEKRIGEGDRNKNK